jgi:hypothetical protein
MKMVKEWAGVIALILIAAYIAFGHSNSNATPMYKDPAGYHCDQTKTDKYFLCPDDPGYKK